MLTFTRRELYDLIWSKPMRDVARELDISDVGLRKTCLSHRIPIPPQGHWNRLRAGHKLRKRPLRKVEEAHLESIVLVPGPFLVPADVREAHREASARERAPDKKIAIDAAAPPSTAVAIALARALKKAKPDEQGLVEASGPKLVHVRVAPESVSRAVAIVDALMRAAADRSFGTRRGEKHLVLVIADEPIELHLSESVRWVLRPQTPEQILAEKRREQEARAKYGKVFSWIYRPESREGDYRPEGRLTIEVANRAPHAHSRWRDTATRKVERMLNTMLADLVAQAAAAKAHRREQARQEEERRQERKRYEARAAAQALWETRVKVLGIL